MDRFVQLHLLTFYPPANLNRDDSGRPKSAIMGGAPRLRVSSQALKRAWRTSDAFARALEGHLAERTQRIGDVVEKHLLEKKKAKADDARRVAREIAGIFGKVKKETDKNPTYTEQLAFISPEEIETALRLAESRLNGGGAIDASKLAEGVLQKSDTAADIAMFGRMLADNPDFNREAAVSVAHAITTHRVVVEDDYYTAVDDLKTHEEDAGAGFIGEAGFGSGVFYLYLVVDRDLLVKNLKGDKALAKSALKALVEAAATVGPRGKSASFASFARASYALIERGDGAPRTLAAAFVEPVDRRKPAPNDLLAESIRCLRDTRAQFARAYPADQARHAEFSAREQGKLPDIVAFAVEGL
jgi:CRISPR system Cascade subunit CasC